MRRLLLVAVVCVLLFAFPTAEGSRMHTIAAIGDSITDAVGRNTVADTDQWLYQLLGRLGETDIALGTHTPPSTPTTPNNKLTGARFTAYNLGVGGNTSQQVRDRFAADALSVNPDTVIIAVGHNDLYANVAPATIAANVEWMIQQAAGASVIVCAVPPWNLDSNAQEDAMVTLNGLYANLCTTYGAYYADWYTPLLTDAVNRDSSYTEPDDIHPDVAGQALLAAAFPLAPFVSVDVAAPFTLTGSAVSASVAMGERTSAACSVLSPGGSLRVEGARFDVSSDDTPGSQTLTVPEGLSTFYLGVTPQAGDGPLSARLGVPQ